MKTLAIVALIFLVGCAGRPTLQQLEAEASVSGDWTAVEKRERMAERMSARTGIECANGLTYICHKEASRNDCSCESAPDPHFYD